MWSRRRPASLRAVTIVRSRRGWRCTSDAQRAPAKPAAPRTATRVWPLATEAAADLPMERTLDRVAPPGGVLVGQRAVVRAEQQAQGQGLPALADLFTAVDVEDGHLAQQVTGRGTHHAL